MIGEVSIQLACSLVLSCPPYADFQRHKCVWTRLSPSNLTEGLPWSPPPPPPRILPSSLQDETSLPLLFSTAAAADWETSACHNLSHSPPGSHHALMQQPLSTSFHLHSNSTRHSIPEQMLEGWSEQRSGRLWTQQLSLSLTLSLALAVFVDGTQWGPVSVEGDLLAHRYWLFTDYVPSFVSFLLTVIVIVMKKKNNNSNIYWSSDIAAC